MTIVSTQSAPGKPSANLLEHAFAYTARAWSIIATRGKKAAGLWKPFQKRRADKTTLRRMFATTGITGLAVITGRVSGGLAVRDFDRPGAYESWARANADHAAALPTVRTSRGYHLYGNLDTEQYITLDDGELRADSRHYVLLPPSVHPEGTIYAWKIPLPEGELPALPSSLFLSGSSCPVGTTQSNPSQPIKHIACATSVAAAIARTLPAGPGRRNRCVFELARHLKALIGDAGPDELREILREWHRQALPTIRTKDFGESWADFALAWERIKRPAGCSFRAAAEAVDSEIVDIANRYDGHLCRLMALCWHLQGQWPDRPFPLGCRTAADYLGVSRVHAWRLLRALQFDRVLRLERKGTKASGKASEWRFIGEQVSTGTFLGRENDGPYGRGDRL